MAQTAQLKAWRTAFAAYRATVANFATFVAVASPWALLTFIALLAEHASGFAGKGGLSLPTSAALLVFAVGCASWRWGSGAPPSTCVSAGSSVVT